MSDQAKRVVKYRCAVCEKPSYQPKTEVDFGPAYGKRNISVCGQCLRFAERAVIFDFITLGIDPLMPFIPSYVVEKVIDKLLDEFRQVPRQGS
ncbi:MAG TPA: hypothetical protein VK254_00940 [Candidatus Bathyarchaeia archaeon]|nr:hypothetical protein [Candidatus Bathyarchaeia archaeon]